MMLPEIGDTVTVEEALGLCEYFRLDYLIARIRANPGGYKDWKFDGCSGLPDQIMGLPTGCKWDDITYKCCLPHDLCYAYGEPGNDIEQERVDLKFYSNLVTKAGMQNWMASAVRVGGKEAFGFSFSWGFAWRTG